MKNIYAALGRLAYGITKPFLKFYLNDSNVRARVLVLNGQNEILLVRSWMGSQRWNLPGGGVEKNETPVQAAVREVKEETGVTVDIKKVKDLGRFANTNPKAPFTVACLMVKVAKQNPQIVGRRKLEMLDAAWFKLDSLPSVRNMVIDKGLGLMAKEKS